MAVPSVGDLAPEVDLPDSSGATHRLSDQRGRWTVVYFYPKDDTPGCTTEACQFRDLDAEFRARSADVWGISPDSATSHGRFQEKFGLTFTLLSDVGHHVAEAYGAWTLKKFAGRSYMGIQRSSFLVDPDGRIAGVWPKVKADGHATEVLAAIAEATPARFG